MLVSCNRNTPVPTPTLDESAVETVVATMLSGFITETPSSEPTMTFTEEPIITLTPEPTKTLVPEPTATFTSKPTTLLPYELYYQSRDSNNKGQIYRLSRDGNEITQITFEENGVWGYDISPVDGTIIYVTQNQLISVDSNGENRKKLIHEPDVDTLSDPHWSPNGKMIAYAADGIKIFYTKTGNIKTIFQEEPNTIPRSFSPDSSKLVFSTIRDINVYDTTLETILAFPQDKENNNANGTINLYGNLNSISWFQNSKNVLIHGAAMAGGVGGIMTPGLWSYNVEDGSGGSLLPPDGTQYVSAPDQTIEGRLTYLYAVGTVVIFLFLSFLLSNLHQMELQIADLYEQRFLISQIHPTYYGRLMVMPS